MRKRALGASGLELTTIGIGTWAIGGGDWKFGWGQQDESEAIAAIIRGIELGINWIDTAAVYGNGQSEVLVGRALKQLTSKPIVATKFGRVIQPDGSISAIIKRESVIAECEASLRRLDVEAIDLYQMHWPEPDADIEEAWQTMIDLKTQGKVRNIGVSNHSPEQMARLHAMHPVASLQPPYNMFARGIEDKTLSFCGENGIGVVCYSPMCKGLLTGKFSADRAAILDETDHRSRDPKFKSPLLEVNLSCVDRLRPIAERAGKTLAQLSIAWTLRRPEVTSAIVGARRPDQIEDTAVAGDWELSDQETAEVESALQLRELELEALGTVDQGRV
ncbi:MAG: aldo/keto reductase [Planctomycetales bacterium]|nr:aldo/keto reductase [Planctomycetales bacterium]